jgi:hypothetical protein
MMLAQWLVALVSASASPAAPPAAESEVPWQRAMEFRQSAVFDPSQYQACAEHFEAVARQLGAEHPRAEEALFEAARCHEEGGAIGPALRIDELLAKEHQNATLGQSALAAVARERLGLARFALAAEAYEEYAQRYPADKRTAGFLAEAATLRSRLEQYDRAKDDLERIEQLFARSSPYTAAEAFWARRELLPVSHASDKARRAHAEEYLKRYGTAGGQTRQLLAIATIGELDWGASCKPSPKDKQAAPLGLCVELKREQPTFCGRPVTLVKVRPRDRRLADRAAQAFRRVIEAVQRMPTDQLQYEPRLRDAAAMAAIRLVDRELETYLDIHMPKNLAFQVDEWRRDSSDAGDRALYDRQKRQQEDSTRRFTEFYQEKTRLAQAAQRKYQAIIVDRLSFAASIAAAARLGVLELDLADEVMQSDADLPPGPEARDAFCKALGERTDAMITGGVQALSLCVTRARMFGAFDDSARFCEEELQRRMPLAFPPLRELVAERQVLGPQEPEVLGVQLEPYGFGEQ